MPRNSLIFHSAIAASVLSVVCVILYASTYNGDVLQSGRHPVTLLEPTVGQVLKHVEVDMLGANSQNIAQSDEEPLVSAESRKLARQTLIGAPIPKHVSRMARTQSLRYTGKYADTSYVINAPQGDPATVFAHNSIWPSKVNSKMPYVETVHGDGTPYMEPLTVYAPPGGTVVTTVLPGTAARPPVPTRYAFLPEADNAPIDNTAYKCAPSGYMVGPIGYHCTPACKDSALWKSDYGDCSLYRDTGLTSSGFKDYCGVDHDIAGIPAAVACPVSCGTCGLGTCYENSGFKKCRLSTYSTDDDSDAVA